MLTCKEIIDLASKRLDSKLKLRDNLGFRLHLIVCKSCTRYSRQLAFIRTVTSSLDKHFKDSTLSSEARERILHNLSNQKANVE